MDKSFRIVAFSPEKGKFATLFADITERKKAEETLHRSEEKYRSLVMNIPDVVWTTDCNGRTTFISSNVENVYGYTPEEIYQEGERLWFDRIHPDDEERVKKSFKAVFEESDPLDIEYRIRRKDGEWIWIRDRSIGSYEKVGSAYADGVFFDISERKQAEEALKESEERYRKIFDTAFDTISVLDGYKFCDCNNIMVEICGVKSKDDIIGLHPWDMSPREQPDGRSSKEKGIEMMNAAYAGKPQRFCWRHKKNDGTLVDVDISLNRFGLGGKKYLMVAGRDITKRKKAEEQAKQHQAELLHVSRLSTIGEMASGLAHELNQPLCAAINYTNACLHSIRSGNADMDELIDNMEAVAKQTERAGQIINSIKNFVKKRKPHRTTVNINHIVEVLPDLVSSEINQNKVSLNLDLEEQAPVVQADPIQIEQVLLNLVLNSIEAMTDSKADERRVVIRTKNLDGAVQIDICDKGQGISEAVSKQIFDSFFTTKPDGLGIGLAVSRSIIEAHNGQFSARNNPDGGATFSFTLPATETTKADSRHGVYLHR
jgi:two-component system sensor kinase FixL